MSVIFKLKLSQRFSREKSKLNLDILKSSQATFGTKRLKVYGPKFQNFLPYNKETQQIWKYLKLKLKIWDGILSSCL